jgi:hypothetical protein
MSRRVGSGGGIGRIGALLRAAAALSITSGLCVGTAEANFERRFDDWIVAREHAVAPVKRKALTKKKSKAVETSKKEPFGPLPKGPLHIVISIDKQRLWLYSNGVKVAEAPVSTGMPGYPTPTGVFSIIQKARFHRSNIYDGAPMPFMQRLTWSGVALHAGVLPGYAASHGCIRLPTEFATRLFAVTRLGARVIVARNEVTPVDIAHPLLFARKERPAELQANAAPGSAVKFAEAPKAITANDALGADELRPGIDVARESAPAEAADTAKPDATPVTATPATAEPAPPPAASASESNPDAAKPEPPRRTGPIAVFVSRKDRKIYVRQGFEPLFDAPVTIRDAEQPFGTHVYTAMEFHDDGATLRWTALSMPGEPEASRLHPPKGQRIADVLRERPGAKAKSAPPLPAPQSAAGVLDRIELPQDAVERISQLMSPGSSLVVSDHGLGYETGKGTDFIVVTR